MSSPYLTPLYYPNSYQSPWLSNAAANGQTVPAASMAQPFVQPPAQAAVPMQPAVQSQRPTYNWSTASGWVNNARIMGSNMRNELQKAFPGDYAHLIGWRPVDGAVRNVKQTAHVMNEVSHHRPVKDHELITFDDNVKRGASLGIATLATLGLKQRIFGVGEYLGMMSWFGAMAATPKLINSMVRLKTGVNLNQNYDSTYGQRLNLYKDPNYLPLHILTPEQIDVAGKKLGVPEGPNRRREIEDKMRQVSVQAHTWCMLAAGPATPVISGLACDLLQDPMTRGINHFKQFKARMEANRVLDLKQTTAQQMGKKTEEYLKQVVGELPESELSGWWKQFGQGLVKHAGFDKIKSADGKAKLDHNMIRNGSRMEQRKLLVDHLMSLAEPNNPRLQKTREFLDQQLLKKEENLEEVVSGRLHEIHTKADNFLNSFEKALTTSQFAEQKQLIKTRMYNAESTINHYRRLFDAIEAASKTKLDEPAKESLRREIESVLSKPTISVGQHLLMRGGKLEARSLVGDPEIFGDMEKHLSKRQGETAAKMMGASPEAHLLDDALKSKLLGNMWRTRMGLYLGGGIFTATALYDLFMVGRDFKPVKSSKPAAGGNA